MAGKILVLFVIQYYENNRLMYMETAVNEFYPRISIFEYCPEKNN
jgi:hypothetical protein